MCNVHVSTCGGRGVCNVHASANMRGRGVYNEHASEYMGRGCTTCMQVSTCGGGGVQ